MQSPQNHLWQRRSLLFLQTALAVYGWMAGISLPVLMLALIVGTFVLLLAFPGRQVVVVIRGHGSAPEAVSEQAQEEAEPAPPAPFNKRLNRFLIADVTQLPCAGSEQTSNRRLWVAAPFGPRRDPKPRWLLRLILERIHHLVHG